jgi:hypothetical protein
METVATPKSRGRRIGLLANNDGGTRVASDFSFQVNGGTLSRFRADNAARALLPPLPHPGGEPRRPTHTRLYPMTEVA